MPCFVVIQYTSAERPTRSVRFVHSDPLPSSVFLLGPTSLSLWVRSFATSVSVCLSVCSVCPLAYIENHASKFHESFCIHVKPNSGALFYVLPVLWMTSRCNANMACTQSDSPGSSTGTKSDVYTIALFVVPFGGLIWLCVIFSAHIKHLPSYRTLYR